MKIIRILLSLFSLSFLISCKNLVVGDLIVEEVVRDENVEELLDVVEGPESSKIINHLTEDEQKFTTLTLTSFSKVNSIIKDIKEPKQLNTSSDYLKVYYYDSNLVVATTLERLDKSIYENYPNITTLTINGDILGDNGYMEEGFLSGNQTIKSFYLKDFNFKDTTSINNLFENSNLEEFNSVDTKYSKVKTFNSVFKNNKYLKTVSFTSASDVSDFYINGNSYVDMFRDTPLLEDVNLSLFDFTNSLNLEGMFYRAGNKNTLIKKPTITSLLFDPQIKNDKEVITKKTENTEESVLATDIFDSGDNIFLLTLTSRLQDINSDTIMSYLSLNLESIPKLSRIVFNFSFDDYDNTFCCADSYNKYTIIETYNQNYRIILNISTYDNSLYIFTNKQLDSIDNKILSNYSDAKDIFFVGDLLTDDGIFSNYTFRDSNIASVSFRNFNFKATTDLSYLFANMQNLYQVDFGSNNSIIYDDRSYAPNLKEIHHLYYNCTNLRQAFGTAYFLDTSNVENFDSLFEGCSNLDVPGYFLEFIDFTSAKTARSMFKNSCEAIKTHYDRIGRTNFFHSYKNKNEFFLKRNDNNETFSNPYIKNGDYYLELKVNNKLIQILATDIFADSPFIKDFIYRSLDSDGVIADYKIDHLESVNSYQIKGLLKTHGYNYLDIEEYILINDLNYKDKYDILNATMLETGNSSIRMYIEQVGSKYKLIVINELKVVILNRLYFEALTNLKYLTIDGTILDDLVRTVPYSGQYFEDLQRLFSNLPFLETITLKHFDFKDTHSIDSLFNNLPSIKQIIFEDVKALEAGYSKKDEYLGENLPNDINIVGAIELKEMPLGKKEKSFDQSTDPKKDKLTDSILDEVSDFKTKSNK